MRDGRSAAALAIMLGACLPRGFGEPSCSADGARAGLCAESAAAPQFQLAACTVFRDEDRFLREWLAFHLCVGIEHFFLYADRPSDDCYMEILQPYVDAGQVTVTRGVSVRNPQIPTYDVCLRDHRHRARWLAFIDVDEFLHPANASLLLRDVLADYADVAGLVVPWTLFGSSQHIAAPAGLVIDNYRYRRRLPECNGHTCAYKAIVQGAFTEHCDVHNHYYADGYFAVNEVPLGMTASVNEAVACADCHFADDQARRRLHDDASLLPMESFPGDFPTDIVRLFHFKTKSLADTLWKLQRKEVSVTESSSSSLHVACVASVPSEGVCGWCRA